ncbi:MAG TPA: SEC61-beta family protein [Candidatus Nanoarchaeia archaeon]|nr:SEC61-beta family protein [Candidatus Nanoarchaeia archaeon]
MADDKISMPSGIGGLVRYFDDYKSKIRFKPGHILVLAGLIILLVLLLHWQGGNWLGVPLR